MNNANLNNKQIIFPGKYYKEHTDKGIYYVAKKEDVIPERMMATETKLINDFLSIDIERSDDILYFTKKYGPIINISWDEFEKASIQHNPSYLLEKKNYPFKDVYAFPEYQFKYFYHLIVNIWELKGDIDRKSDNKCFLKNFLRLLLQPYAKCKYEDKYLGIPCDELIGRFPYFYFQSVKGEIDTFTVKSFLIALKAVVQKNLDEIEWIRVSDNDWYNEAPIIKGETGERRNIVFPSDFLAFNVINLYDELLSVLGELLKTNIFDFLDSSDEEIKRKVKNPDYQIYERVRKLSRILIKDIVNTYISSPQLDMDEKSEYEMSSNPNYLLQILFDALSVTLVNYEVRVCGARKCNNKFIAKKGKKKNYCCKKCADSHGKYLKNHPNG